MRAAATIIFGIAAAQLLSGCIVAAVPLAAGAAIARSEVKRKQPPRVIVEQAPSATAAVSATAQPTATIAASPAPATTLLPLTALPKPDAAAEPQFAPLINHIRSRATLWQEGAPIKSLALDEKRTVLSPVAVDCQRRPPVLVIDLDPATADPDLRMIDADDPSPAAFSPADGLAAALAAVRTLDVGIVWITNHKEASRGNLAKLLQLSGLDPSGADQIMAIGAEGQSKQALRLNVARSACILGVVGDKRGDADEAYDYLRNPNAMLPIDSNWGEGWFLLPAPLTTEAGL